MVAILAILMMSNVVHAQQPVTVTCEVERTVTDAWDALKKGEKLSFDIVADQELLTSDKRRQIEKDLKLSAEFINQLSPGRGQPSLWGYRSKDTFITLQGDVVFGASKATWTGDAVALKLVVQTLGDQPYLIMEAADEFLKDELEMDRKLNGPAQVFGNYYDFLNNTRKHVAVFNQQTKSMSRTVKTTNIAGIALHVNSTYTVNCRQK